MEKRFAKPKGFGEILDHTFSLSKAHFKGLVMILLIIMGPVFLLEAIVGLFSGQSFLREAGSGGAWYEQIISGFQKGADGTVDSSSLSADWGLILVGLLSFIFFPVADAAILFVINHIRRNEEYTVRLVLKEAFSRFWPMLGSTILFALIAIGLIIVPGAVIGLTSFFGAMANPFLGVLLGIILFLGFALGIGLLLTRWSFYFASVVLDKKSPGFGRSWRLSRKRTWATLGLYIVFYLIVAAISFAVQGTFSAILGNSVLNSIITNLTSLFTTLFFSVGYAVMYLDLKTRHDAEDLKEMIQDYEIENV
ncbi:hypothetical protein [Neobacillus terrae]|uniref:hypothetical protein n=1 Tax=Neobacillus terrae TaxID=3034837 RepID=UPI00140CE35A|nr:hypothetical protein [Neobacillus terrae]NHM34024.1 hypothetical protein [Neobacillus terrae]